MYCTSLDKSVLPESRADGVRSNLPSLIQPMLLTHLNQMTWRKRKLLCILPFSIKEFENVRNLEGTHTLKHAVLCHPRKENRLRPDLKQYGNILRLL